MAYGHLKTEMRGDTSPWGYRADVKRAARRLRREGDWKTTLESHHGDLGVGNCKSVVRASPGPAPRPRGSA